MRLVFAKTRYSYDSYSDFWKLVELSGLETCWIDHIDYEQEALYVLTPINGETRPVIDRERKSGKKKRALLAWWNLERPDSGPGGLNDLLGSMVCNNTNGMLEWVDKIWTSDAYQHSLDPRAVHVVMGSDLRLAMGVRDPISYDFCHMSCDVGRRNAIIGSLRDLRIGPNAWGAERSKIVNGSRMMLNIHQTDANIGEPLRFAVAAAHGIPLISETLVDPYPLENGKSCLIKRYEELQQTVRESLHCDMEILGAQLKEVLTVRFPFRDCALKGLQDSLV
jgi:hypothetical protein